MGTDKQGAVRFATIGTSMITGQFLEALEVVDGAELAGCYSRDAQKAADYAHAHGAEKSWSSLDDLARDPDVDAVYIASPNACHEEQALEMIAAGKSVLVEKPFCLSQGAAERVMEAAKERGVVAMEAMRLAHDPAYLQIREACGQLGRIRRASFHYGKYSSRYDLVLKHEHTNIFDPKLGTGALMDLGIYPVNALVLLFGEPDDLSGFADTIDVTGDDDLIDLCGTAVFDYPSMIADVAYSKVTTDPSPCTIEGEKATLVFSNVSSPEDVKMVAIDGTVTELPARHRDNGTDHEVNNMEFEIRDFAGHVKAGHWPEQANHNTLVALGIMDALRLSEGIEFPGDERDPVA